jgi:hypothetical protein
MRIAAIPLLMTWKTHRQTVNAVIASTRWPVGVNPVGVGRSRITTPSAIAMARPTHFMLLALATGGAAPRAEIVSCVVAIVGLLLITWNRHDHRASWVRF